MSALAWGIVLSLSLMAAAELVRRFEPAGDTSAARVARTFPTIFLMLAVLVIGTTLLVSLAHTFTSSFAHFPFGMMRAHAHSIRFPLR